MRFTPPRLTEVVNPIASGDCLAAGIAWATLRGCDLADAVRWGIAVAAANVEELLPARMSLERVRELYQEVKFEVL